jgi:hypothetical protein
MRRGIRILLWVGTFTLVGFWAGASRHFDADIGRNPGRSPSIRVTSPSLLHDNPGNLHHIKLSPQSIPRSFELNQGQTEASVRFLSRGPGYTMFLTPTETILRFSPLNKPPGSARDSVGIQEQAASTRAAKIALHPFSLQNLIGQRFADPFSGLLLLPTIAHEKAPGLEPWRSEKSMGSSVLRMKLQGANEKAEIFGCGLLAAKSNYFLGNDPAKWRTAIPNYARVRVQQVYPGVDVEYYGNQAQLEYDLIVQPGADPRTIRLRFEEDGTSDPLDTLAIDPDGNLLLANPTGIFCQHKPAIYQEIQGRRKQVEGGYVLVGDREIGLQIAGYDRDRPLRIDPVLSYSTFLGGHGFDAAVDIVVDSRGRLYVTGVTDSVDFPIPGAVQPQFGGGSGDVFVFKFDLNSLLYSTYLGGSASDSPSSIALDFVSNVFIAGVTQSPNFPLVKAIQTSKKGASDAFVTRLSSDGARLDFSTYLGGSGDDSGTAIAVTSGVLEENIYVAGVTSSNDFPVTAPLQALYGGGGSDAFLVKLDGTKSPPGIVYSTYLGGSGLDGATGLAVDSLKSCYLAGTTTSTDFPTAGAFQPKIAGLADGFVAKVKPNGDGLVYASYLGGNGNDQTSRIAVDSLGRAYLTGSTDSADFPTTTSLGIQYGGNGDAFIARLNSAGTGLDFSTLLGGSGFDSGTGIALDSAGNVLVSGATTSTDFPTVNAIQWVSGGKSDAFVAKLDAAGAALVYSTYLGGSGEDAASSISVDSSGNVYITGGTSSSDFPVNNPFQLSLAGSSDAFVAKISETGPLGEHEIFVPIVLSTGGLNNSFFTSEMTVANNGTTDLVVSYAYTASFGGGSGTASDFLPVGQQMIVPDAIEYLRSRGVPLPSSGNRGGTLLVQFSGTGGAITIRTTTGVSGGRAGLAYAGIPVTSGLTGTAYLCGLRQNTTDRSNVAIQNAGDPSQGSVVLRLTVNSGDPSTSGSVTLPDATLAPGAFLQFSGILQSNGLSLNNGFVQIQRVSGSAPYYAYGVINDQANSDGSLIPPLQPNSLAGKTGLILPVIVETSAFSSELVVANFSQIAKTLQLAYVASGIQSSGSTARFDMDLQPGQQIIQPEIVNWMRQQNVPGVGPRSGDLAGSLFATAKQGDISGIFLGARTSTPGGGGRYGVFYTATPYGTAATDQVWLYGLQQNTENRTNLALINTGETGAGSDTFRIELFDGATGLLAGTLEGVTLAGMNWKQIGNILAAQAPGTAQGYARVTRTAGTNPFLVYSVINDGGQPGQRSGDGAFLYGTP